MSPAAPRDARSAHRLFRVALALAASPLLLLAAGRRAPVGGSPFEPGGLLQPALFLPGRFLLPLSAIGLVLQDLLLLAGVWRLAGRLFPSPATRFFVAVSALGSSLWVDPAAPGLRVAAALPMILALLHEALETPSRSALPAAGGLLILQAMGLPPGTALALPAAVALYGFGAALFFNYPLVERLRAKTPGPAAGLGVLAILGISLTVAWATGPDARGSSSALRAILEGGGLTHPARLLDLALGVSPSPDAWFCGLLTVASAGLGLSLPERKPVVPFLAIAMAGLLAAGMLAGGVNHLASAAAISPVPPLLKLFVIGLAGAGFQALLDGRFRGTRAVGAAAAALAFICLGLAALSEATLADPAGLRPVAELLSLRPEAHPAALGMQRIALDSDLPGISSLMAGLAAGVLFLWNSGRRGAPAALALALVLHPLDLFGWKFRMIWLNTSPVASGFDPGPGPVMPAAWAAALGLLALGVIAFVLRELVLNARSARP